MTLQVYCDPCTVNSHKALAGLELLGADYKNNHVDYFKAEQKNEENTKRNPYQTLPYAIDGDLILTESNAILAYAADLNNADSPAYPRDPKIRAKINQYLLWETSAWFPSNYIYLVEYAVKPILGAEPDEKIIEAEAPRWNKFANILDTQLGKTKFIVGDTPTIADIALAAPVHLHEVSRLPLDKYPNLKRWYNDVDQLPAWRKTMPPVDALGAMVPCAKPKSNGASATNNTDRVSLPDVKAKFQYTKDIGTTELYFYETEKAKGIHEPGDDGHEMTVHNGWSRASSFDVDKHGFSLHDFKASYNDWQTDNLDKVSNEFYPEVVEFLKRTLGAKRVLVFDHTIRSERNAAKKLSDEKNTSQRTPVILVHCDYTSESGPLRVKQLLPNEADELLQRRVAFINVWKPINRVVEERPLAMIDVTSSDPSDFFKLYLRYRERDGENYVLRHSDKHEWVYFPKMTPDEVILLKTFDSADDGRARFVAHSAFVDPTSPKDAPLRESVEIRTICFF